MPIVVDGEPVPTDLSVEGFCRHMNKAPAPAAESAEYDELELHLQAAVDVVNARCGPLAQTERTVRLREGAGYVILPPGPISAVGAVHGPDGALLSVDVDYEVDLAAGVLSVPHRGYDSRGRWEVTLTMGYADGNVPRTLVLATYIIAAHLWGTQRPGQSRRLPGGMGSDAEPPPLMGFAIPNRALELMENYRHGPGVR